MTTADVQLEIAELVVEAELSRGQAERLGGVIATALEQVAARLAEHGPDALARLSSPALQLLELAPDQLQRVLEPGGASELADVLLATMFGAER